jgi:hypothetical protein
MADRGSILMIVGYVAGLGMLGYELQREPTLPPPPTGQAGGPIPALEVPPSEIKSIAAYDAINERPLFTPSRRPDEVAAGNDEAPAVADTTDNIDGYRLAAVLKGFGNNTALIEDPSGQTQTLHQGERLGKWEVLEIQDDRVTVLLDSQRKTLLVHRFDPVATQFNPRRRPASAPTGRRLIRPPVTPPAAAPIPLPEKR